MSVFSGIPNTQPKLKSFNIPYKVSSNRVPDGGILIHLEVNGNTHENRRRLHHVHIITVSMTNPFDLNADLIATGIVVPAEVTAKVVTENDIRIKQMKQFVEDRLNSTTTGFFEPLHKFNLLTFATLCKRFKSKVVSDKTVTINVVVPLSCSRTDERLIRRKF
ncbi:unnamed protein product [Caretta caretta]